MKRVILIADDGYIYTDGENYGTLFFLAIGADKSKYYQVPYAEYEKFLTEGELDCLP